MKVSTSTRDRDQTLMLLKIERIQYCEQMALLGYKEEKATRSLRGKLVRRPPYRKVVDGIHLV